MIYKNITILAVGFIIGIILSFFLQVPVYILAALIASGMISAAFIMYNELKWRELPLVLSLLAMLAIGIPAGNLRMQIASEDKQEGSAWHYLHTEHKYKNDFTIRGIIDAEPELRHYGTIDLKFRLTEIYDEEKSSWVDIEDAVILLKIGENQDHREEFLELADSDSYGYELEIAAKRKYIPKQKNPETFNYASYLEQQNMIALFDADITDVQIKGRKHGFFMHEMAFALKNHFLSTYKKTIKAPASMLVSGATLGTRRALDGITFGKFEIPETFRRAGVGHVLAVSGLHVSIVSLLLYSIFVMTGFRPSHFAPVIIILLLFFTLLTGARPSTMRATVMNSVTLIAFAYFRYNLRKATYIGLSVSSLLILLLNPHVLFSASFLLSFGAVLSLVLITPTLSKWLFNLRGFTLIFMIVYVLTLVFIANTNILVFMQLPALLTMAALLWILIRLGRILNDRFPFMWKFAYRALPLPVHSLIVAQFAIQLGMMIPLNAWFFGQFPVAGIFVNMAAIPLIGIIVQLGILTGLAGLIPFVGSFAALPFGAFSHTLSQFFLYLADAGASAFNYPVTPKPSLLWMGAYYAALFLILSMDKFFPFFQTTLYKLNHRFKTHFFRYLPAVFAAVLLVIPLIINALSTVKPATMIVYDERNNPITSLSLSDGTGVVFNSGSSYFTDRVLFGGIRYSGAASLRAFVLPSYSEYKIEAINEFSNKIEISSLFLPKSEEEKEIRIADQISLRNVSFFNLSETVSFSYYQDADKERSQPIEIEASGKKILLVPDYSNWSLPKSEIGSKTTYDIMICPHINKWKEYYYIVDIARKTKPKLLIATNGQRSGEIYAQNIPEKLNMDFPVITTDSDGAAVIRFKKGRILVSTVLTKRKFELE